MPLADVSTKIATVVGILPARFGALEAAYFTGDAIQDLSPFRHSRFES